jgi:hypothetical protein
VPAQRVSSAALPSPMENLITPTVPLKVILTAENLSILWASLFKALIRSSRICCVHFVNVALEMVLGITRDRAVTVMALPISVMRLPMLAKCAAR